MAPSTPPVRSSLGLVLATAALGGAFLIGLDRYLLGLAPARTPEVAVLEDAPAEPVVPLPLVEPPPPPAGWDISNIDHPRVDYWIRRFQTDKRDKFEGFLQRKGTFEPLISSALSRHGLPQDLLYLAMVESGFQTRAYSRAHAAGLWQFIRGTAVRYGLEINRAVDERNDPVKATTAALRYLGDLHRQFGSWYLAAAAYNTGENRIARILRRATGRRRGTDVDYYRIWAYLPAETRDYVPLMVAAARISKDPARYGFEVAPHAPWEYEHVTARPGTPLLAVARQAGTSVAQIRALNPHLKLDRTRADRAMQLRVPRRPSGSAPTAGPAPGTLVAD